MPWSMRTEGGQVLVVRQRDKKVVGRHKDRKRALAQLRVLSSLEKASFGGDRSEAARYAANMRWKNQTPKQKLDALGSKELKIVEIRGDETFKKKDGSFNQRATLIVLDDDGKEIQVDVRSEGVKGSQFIQVEAKRGNKQIGYLWAQTDYDGQYGQKGKVAIGQVDVISSERRKGVATALMRLGKRYNIGSEPIYHSTVLTPAGAAFARDTEIEKASFGGDRSAAGRYAANQRWKGHAKDATKPATRERRMAEKFQEGPILKNGYDNFGFPRLLTSDEAKKQFGDTVTMQVAYFASRGVKLMVNDQTSDKLPRFDTESPAYFAVLQALDDVLDQVDDTKLNSALPSKSGLFPEVMINDYYENSRDTTGGYFLASSNDVALFMNTPQLIEKAYTDGKPFTVLTVPQLTADAIQGGLFGKDSVSARIAYGFTVHEMGHWIDYSLGNQWDGPPKGFWSKTLTDKVSKDPAKASDAEMSFALDYTTNMTDTGVRGSQYSNTAPVERFAENFTAWFTLTKVNELRTNELKQTLAARGGTLAVEAALEVLKQDAIVDNVLNWRPDHPVFLFAFYGEPFDVDALKKQSLLDLLKASFGGDRSAAGRYAANQRWKGQGDKKPEGVKSLKSAIVDALPMAMKLKSKPWGAGDESHYEMMVEMGHSKKSAKLATSGSITLADYGDPAVAAGNCGIASVDVGGFLIREGLAKEGEVFMREVGEPANGGEGGTHFVTHIGPKDSEDAIIVDFTLRQFDADADFPWVGTVKEYRETGYETDEVMGPEMGDESFDKILASGEVVYPWNEPGFKGDTDSK